MTELKQKLINFKYLYISWWLYPAIQLVLSMIIGIGYIIFFNPDFLATLVISGILMMAFCSHYHMTIIIWNKISKTKNICSICNKPAKFLRKNEFQCLNPDCGIDLILEEEEN